MTAAPGMLPGEPQLLRALQAVLKDRSPAEPVVIVDRTPLPSGTAPKEVVTYEDGDGERHRLFWKYEPVVTAHSHGHRGGVRYEAEVFRHVLTRSASPVPTFSGCHLDEVSQRTSLALEYLEGSLPVNMVPLGDGIEAAARWAGRFHAGHEERIEREPWDFLTRYDRPYYLGWARRAWARFGHSGGRPPWLGPACDGYEHLVTLLLQQPATVIHGEYTVKNVLAHDGRVVPVDWESAAVGVGEVDLAFLLDGWPADVAADCERAYREARWPEGSDAPFEQVLGAARLYLGFRWLGRTTHRSDTQSSEWYLGVVRDAAERLGLL